MTILSPHKQEASGVVFGWKKGESVPHAKSVQKINEAFPGTSEVFTSTLWDLLDCSIKSFDELYLIRGDLPTYDMGGTEASLMFLNSLYYLRMHEYGGDSVGHYKFTELVYRWSPYFLREQGVFVGYEEELVDSIYSLSKLVPSTSSSIIADKELLMEYAKKESDYQINYSERPVFCFPGLAGNFADGMLEILKEGKRKHRYKPDIFLFSDKYPYLYPLHTLPRCRTQLSPTKK
jgi:hypothetical protein